MSVGLTALGAAAWAAFLVIQRERTAVDAHAYFLADYGIPWGANDSYVYSPAFAQAIEPLRWLGYDTFRDLWRTAEATILVVLAGPFSAPLVLANPTALEVAAGNVHLLIAAVIVAGFRWPALWAFVLLTKVTPGVGLLWFAVRREWRSLAIALGATAAIAVASFAISPSSWVAWVDVLRAPTAVDSNAIWLALPLLVRLPLALALIAWGAQGNRRWVLPVAVVLAMPSVWITSLSVLVAVPFLWARRRELAPVGQAPPYAGTRTPDWRRS